jgi:putative peptidoglycan lipid II flippase
LVFGVIVGAISHFLIQLPSLLKLGWRFNYQLGFGSSHVRHVLRLMIPRAIALTGNQLLILTFYRIASNFQSGSIAIYKLTDDLQNAPVLLFANTLAMAVLPDFARHIALAKHEEFEELVGKSLRLILYLFLPLTTFLLLYRTQIIELYIAIGHSIKPSETHLAVMTFSFFVISLFFQGTILLLGRAYFAHHDTIRPTTYSLTGIFIAWSLAGLLAKFTHLGVVGLSLSFSVGSTINAFLLWFNLKLPFRLIWRDSNNRLNLPLIVLGTLVTATILFITRYLGPSFSQMFLASQSGHNLLEISFGLIVGLIFYLSWSQTFQLEQWNLIKPVRNNSTTK